MTIDPKNSYYFEVALLIAKDLTAIVTSMHVHRYGKHIGNSELSPERRAFRQRERVQAIRELFSGITDTRERRALRCTVRTLFHTLREEKDIEPRWQEYLAACGIEPFASASTR